MSIMASPPVWLARLSFSSFLVLVIKIKDLRRNPGSNGNVLSPTEFGTSSMRI